MLLVTRFFNPEKEGRENKILRRKRRIIQTQGTAAAALYGIKRGPEHGQHWAQHWIQLLYQYYPFMCWWTWWVRACVTPAAMTGTPTCAAPRATHAKHTCTSNSFNDTPVRSDGRAGGRAGGGRREGQSTTCTVPLNSHITPSLPCCRRRSVRQRDEKILADLLPWMPLK